MRRLPRQQPVNEDPGHHRVDDAEQIGYHGSQHDKSHGRRRALQPFPGKFKCAPALSGGCETLAGRKRQHQAGKGRIKFFHAYGHRAPRRIIQHCFAVPKPVQYDKVVEVPVNNTWEGTGCPEVFHLHPVPVRFQAVILGGQVYVFHIGSIPADAAVQAHLFQRDPFLIICQDHSQTGRAALQRFHLHNHRHLCNAVFDGPFRFLFRHSRFSRQFHRKLIGVLDSVTSSASYSPSGI